MSSSSVERARDLGRALVLLDTPDPRVLQSLFAALVVADLVLRDEGGQALRIDPAHLAWPTVGLLLALATQAAALVTPWARCAPWVVGILPVVDLGAVGLIRLNPAGSGAGMIAVLPAMWLGRQFGRQGVLAATVSSFVGLGVTSLAYFGVDGRFLSRTLLDPGVAALAAAVMAVALAGARRERRAADRHASELAVALAEIERRDRMVAAIFDSVDIGLVLLDRNGAYLTINKRHQDFMRLAFPAGHAGQAGQLGEVYAADGVTPVPHEEMPTYRASHGEEFDDCRIWCGTDPLTARALSVSARTVRDPAGHFDGAALAYKDVTEFMRALRVKDEFVASVSHELRTPLTSIEGFTSLVIEREDLPTEAVHQLGVVLRNADRLDRLVSDLLQTAQVDNGSMHVVRAHTDLAGLVREAVDGARPAAEAAGLELAVQAPSELCALVDAQRISQVVDNLVSNAVKYTPPGGQVRVELAVDGSMLELVVADTGIGISGTDRHHLFNRFFRAQHAAEQSIQGIGLGLSISKAIVEAHGGWIDVESEIDCGSVFRVRLPLDVPAQSAQPIRAAG